MKRSAMKVACNVAMRDFINYKLIRATLSDRFGKHKFVLAMIASILIIGIPIIFVLAK